MGATERLCKMDQVVLVQVQTLGSPRAEGVYHCIEPRQVVASERENVLNECVLRLGGVFGPHDSGNFMPAFDGFAHDESTGLTVCTDDCDFHVSSAINVVFLGRIQ